MTRAIPKPSRFESPAYLRFVRQHHCAVANCWKWTHAHHVVFEGQGRVGSKVDDTQAVPLCERHHEQYHRLGREAFAFEHGLNLAAIVIELLTEYIRQAHSDHAAPPGAQTTKEKP